MVEENLEDWCQDQKEDPAIALIYKGKETGERPSHSEILAEEVSSQIYWAYWDALILKNGILYRVWRAPNLKSNVLQIIVPRKRMSQILREVHDSSTGRHFIINKTLDKICRRFFWATCQQDVED